MDLRYFRRNFILEHVNSKNKCMEWLENKRVQIEKIIKSQHFLQPQPLQHLQQLLQ